MPTLLKRFGNVGILGNAQGDTFLYQTNDESDWDAFDQPARLPTKHIRRLTTVGPPGVGGLLDATWHSTPMPVVTHGTMTVQCYFEGTAPSKYTPGWYVFEGDA
jgi:hypothetical protein